jgi:geranylgeranylglycerol-phosphate geranylgeranyltransferase
MVQDRPEAITAIPLGLSALLLVAGCMVLLWSYSHLLIISGILGNWIVAAMVWDRPQAMLYPTGFLFCYILVKEIISNLTQTVLFNCPVGTLNPTGLY